MALHAGLIVFKYAAKPALEIAFEYYVKSLIKYEKGYLKHQIDSLCDNGNIPDDSYATRVRGYYSIEEAMQKIIDGKSDLSKQIHSFSINIHEDDGFTIVDL